MLEHGLSIHIVSGSIPTAVTNTESRMVYKISIITARRKKTEVNRIPQNRYALTNITQTMDDVQDNCNVMRFIKRRSVNKARNIWALSLPLLDSKVKVEFVRSAVLTAVVKKSPTFWHVTPCGPLKVDRRFGGICRIHF
jgi:hypothetical protein